MKKFEVGAMYWDTSAVDHNDVMVVKITRRTEKSVWFVRMHGGKEDGEPSRTKVFANNSYEYIMPYRYSMAPVWEADRKAEPETAEETADAPVSDEPAPEADAMTTDAAATEAPAGTAKSRKAKAPKQYTIRVTRDRTGRTHDHTGTLEELTERFFYTLEKGKSWEWERGRRKINLAPKTARSLVTNLQNASDNAAANGYSGIVYELVPQADAPANDKNDKPETVKPAPQPETHAAQEPETAEDSEAGRPAPQEDAAPEGAESVEAEAASAVRATRNPVAPYDLFQFHAESGAYLFENEGEAALIDALEFHADAENALSVVRALYEITHDGGGWFSPHNHPVMLDALNAYIEFMTGEIEVFDNFPNAVEKEIAVGKLAEAKVIRDAFAADVARAAAETTQEAETEIIKAEPIGNGRVLRLVRDGAGYGIETVEPSGNGAFQVGWAATERGGLEAFAKMKPALEVKTDACA